MTSDMQAVLLPPEALDLLSAFARASLEEPNNWISPT
jgi:hypothetical protein